MSTQREHTQKAHTYTLSKSTFEEVSELVEKYGYTKYYAIYCEIQFNKARIYSLRK